MTLDERITIGLMFARPTIKRALEDAALRHGFTNMRFERLPNGEWMAEDIRGRRTQLWYGSLVDVWKVAHGRIP